MMMYTILLILLAILLTFVAYTFIRTVKLESEVRATNKALEENELDISALNDIAELNAGTIKRLEMKAVVGDTPFGLRVVLKNEETVTLKDVIRYEVDVLRGMTGKEQVVIYKDGDKGIRPTAIFNNDEVVAVIKEEEEHEV